MKDRKTHEQIRKGMRETQHYLYGVVPLKGQHKFNPLKATKTWIELMAKLDQLEANESQVHELSLLPEELEALEITHAYKLPFKSLVNLVIRTLKSDDRKLGVAIKYYPRGHGDTGNYVAAWVSRQYWVH